MARSGLPLHYRTRKIIPEHLHLIDERVCASPRFAKTFFNIFIAEQLIFKKLRKIYTGQGLDVSDEVIVQGVQAMGGAGYLSESPLSRIMRDAKLMEIGAGTSEIRRMLVGRELMKATG